MQVPNEGIMDSEDGLRINRSPQASTNQKSFFQIGVEQVGIPQSSFGQISSEQVSFTQVNITPINSTQNSISQIGFAQINFNQVTPNHTSSEQIGFTQITSFNTNATQVSTSQINSSQINIFKDSGRTQIDSSEVTLSGSITLEQFLSIHNLSFASNNTYKDNPLNLFDLSFNIALQIADLPIGQLAEAQLTQFDSNGGSLKQ